jgi:hypothetical protein
MTSNAGVRRPPYYPTGVPPEGGTISPRVDKPDYAIDPETGCWVWQRALTHDGYARVQPTKPTVSKRKIARGETKPILVVSQYAAHEYWRRVVGPLAPDEHLRRTCGNRLCVNPEHGEPETTSEKFKRIHRAMSPLTADDVQMIRAAAKGAVAQARLAERYGISSASISNIVTNQTWHDPEYVPGIERRCALPGCRRPFRTMHPWKHHCRGAHKRRHAWAHPHRVLRTALRR